jgi:hypothetical protein
MGIFSLSLLMNSDIFNASFTQGELFQLLTWCVAKVHAPHISLPVTASLQFS